MTMTPDKIPEPTPVDAFSLSRSAGWRMSLPELWTLATMNLKSLKSWAGLISVIWMVGIYEIFDYPPYVFFNALFGIEKSSQLSLVVDLLIWLGVGLLFAIVGLRCWKSPRPGLCDYSHLCVYLLRMAFITSGLCS
jgi:hypothetical protein